MKNKKNPNKRGFSIGEVVLSVFILSIGILGIMQLFTKSIKEFADERDEVIASMLAQEGVELVRNIRDNNWASRDRVKEGDDGTATWRDTYEGLDTDSNSCIIDYDSTSLDCAGSNYSLRQDGLFYNHDSGLDTKFARRIVIENDPIKKNLIVTSFVSWDDSDPIVISGTCTTTKKCVFSELVLRDWGTGS